MRGTRYMNSASARSALAPHSRDWGTAGTFQLPERRSPGESWKRHAMRKWLGGFHNHGGTPKWMAYNGKCHKKGWFGVPLFQEPSIWDSLSLTSENDGFIYINNEGFNHQSWGVNHQKMTVVSLSTMGLGFKHQAWGCNQETWWL